MDGGSPPSARLPPSARRVLRASANVRAPTRARPRSRERPRRRERVARRARVRGGSGGHDRAFVAGQIRKDLCSVSIEDFPATTKGANHVRAVESRTDAGRPSNEGSDDSVLRDLNQGSTGQRSPLCSLFKRPTRPPLDSRAHDVCLRSSTCSSKRSPWVTIPSSSPVLSLAPLSAGPPPGARSAASREPRCPRRHSARDGAASRGRTPPALARLDRRDASRGGRRRRLVGRGRRVRGRARGRGGGVHARVPPARGRVPAGGGEGGARGSGLRAPEDGSRPQLHLPRRSRARARAPRGPRARPCASPRPSPWTSPPARLARTRARPRGGRRGSRRAIRRALGRGRRQRDRVGGRRRGRRSPALLPAAPPPALNAWGATDALGGFLVGDNCPRTAPRASARGGERAAAYPAASTRRRRPPPSRDRPPPGRLVRRVRLVAGRRRGYAAGKATPRARSPTRARSRARASGRTRRGRISARWTSDGSSPRRRRRRGREPRTLRSLITTRCTRT